MPANLPSYVVTVLEFMAVLFIFVVELLCLGLIVTYVVDVTQTKNAVRRNYPVFGRFRYFSEHVGEFFRQYFFAMDREELPFNRVQRSWSYRAAKGMDTSVAFGSARDLRPPGTVLFVNCPYPTLGEDAVPPRPLTIGPNCEQPYTTASLLNISGMSYRAVSRPAVQALSAGVYQAGCWLNTGEGGLSPYHLEGGAEIVFQTGTAKNGIRDLEGGLNEGRLREVAAHPRCECSSSS